MEERKQYEKEYSVWEIFKYNLRNWPIIVVFALAGALILGIYQYKDTEPTVVYYQELKQVNGSFFIHQYNSQSISERMYDMRMVAESYDTYLCFMEENGYTLTYDEYKGMYMYTDAVTTSVVTVAVGYPENYGEIVLETEEDALELMNSLLSTWKNEFDKIMGSDTIVILSEAYATTYTQAPSYEPSTTKDILYAVVKGMLAGAAFGILLGVLIVTIRYLLQTIVKNAEEIGNQLQMPVIAYVHKKSYKEDLKNVRLYLNKGEKEIINYLPINEKEKTDAFELAKLFSEIEKRTLFVDLSMHSNDDKNSISEYLLGEIEGKEVGKANENEYLDIVRRNVQSEKGKEVFANDKLAIYLKSCRQMYDVIIVNSPDLSKTSDGYAIAKICGKTVIACTRQQVSNTELYSVYNATQIHDIAVDGVVVYGIK